MTACDHTPTAATTERQQGWVARTGPARIRLSADRAHRTGAAFSSQVRHTRDVRLLHVWDVTGKVIPHRPPTHERLLMKTITIASSRVNPLVFIDMLEDVARERDLRDWTFDNFPERQKKSSWEPLKKAAKNLGLITTTGNHPTSMLVEYVDADPTTRKAILGSAFASSCDPALKLGTDSSLDELYELLGDLGVNSLDKSRLFLVGMADYLDIEIPVSWRSPHPSSRRPRASKNSQKDGDSEDFADVTDDATRERQRSKRKAGPTGGESSSKLAHSITSQPEFDRLLRLQSKIVSQLPESPSHWGPRLLPVLEIMIDYLVDQEGSGSDNT